MKKTAFVINGSGGVGKDTLCALAAKHYKTVNVSSIDPIKSIARENGWTGEKTNEARRFLSELKRVFTEYNQLPFTYTLDAYKKFLSSDDELFFVHIREGSEIERFVQGVKEAGGDIKTLLVRSKRTECVYGNSSDDGVEDYPYDFIYQNDLSLDEAEADFVRFLEDIRSEDNK